MALNLLSLPSFFSGKLGISVFASGILLTCFLVMVFMGFIGYVSKFNGKVMIITIFLTCSFAVSITWLPVWIMIVNCMFLAISYAKIWG